MKLRHIRRDEEQTIRERIARTANMAVSFCREEPSDAVVDLFIDGGDYGASILAHVRAAGIHPTADGWMVDEEHGQAEPRRALPSPWAWYKVGDVHVLRSRPAGDGADGQHLAAAWRDAWNVFAAENSSKVIAGIALGEKGCCSPDENMSAAERECWKRGLFGDVPKPAPATPKPTLADRIAALIEDHVRDTRAERDAYKRELDELRARVGEFVDRMSKP